MQYLRKHVCPLLTLLVFSATGFAQEFVPNGSFEVFYSNCEDFGADCAKSWYKPSMGTTDYINTKNKRYKPADKKLDAWDENACIGMYGVNGEEREYLSTHVHFTMRENHIYRLTFWSKRVADSSTVTTPLQVHFSEKPVIGIEHKKRIPLEAHATVVPETNGEWSRNSLTYIAQGGEHYLTLGYFEDELLKQGTCYWLIDSISMVPIGIKEELDEEPEVAASEPKDMADEEDKRSIAIDEEGIEEETITLESIHFKEASSELSEGSFKELDGIVSRLKGKSDFKVEIHGHTDNVGDAKENLALSKARAKAVVDYLIAKGIPSSSLSWKGFGSNRPRASNDTEEGRRKNRRVECKITY